MIYEKADKHVIEANIFNTGREQTFATVYSALYRQLQLFVFY